MLASLVVASLGVEIVGLEVFIDNWETLSIAGKTVQLPVGEIWRVVGKVGTQYRLVADNPARVALIPADPAHGGEYFDGKLRSRVARQDRAGWWSPYVGKEFWAYMRDYMVGSLGPYYADSAIAIRVEAAVPLEGKATVFLDGGALDTFFNLESNDRVMFVVSFITGSADLVSESMLRDGRVWTTEEIAGEWDAQRHFSERSLKEELGYSRQQFYRKFRSGIQKGMTKRELAWHQGWPHMALSPAEAFKTDVWRYNSIPPGEQYTFKDGKLASWIMPTLP